MSLPEMSLSGAALILAITVLRAVAVNRLPKRTFLALWAVALGRLMIPYQLPSTLSIYTLLARLAPAKNVAVGTTVVTAVPMVPAENQTVVAAPSVPSAVAPSTVDILSLLWLAGALCCAAFFAVNYLRCRREFGQSLPVDQAAIQMWLEDHPLRRRVSVRICERVSTPLTYGALRPVILLPKTTVWEDTESLDYVLTHELVHIRRFDAVAKLVLAVTLCIHWFNPAVWVMYILANRDLELSCDEAVVRQFGADAKVAYAMALIHMEESRGGAVSLCNYFSKNAMEERIVAIMKIKKTSLVALVLAVGLVLGVTVAFATSAKEPPVAQSSGENSAKPTIELQHITSYVDRYDGKTYYSTDNGQTWREGDVFTETGYAFDDVDWWTAEEYEKWLDEQKKELQSMLGERSWNPTEGWYTWDQARIDEAIAGNEQLLQEIRDGKLVSKPTADGDTMIQFSYDPRAIETLKDEITLIQDAKAQEVDHDAKQTKALLEAYVPFGLHYDIDSSTGKLNMSWQGKPVHSVFDAKKGVWIANSMRGLYLGPDAIDLQAVYDSNGTLAGLEETEESVANVADVTEMGDETETRPMEGYAERSQAELLAEYGPWGISFDGAGNMLYEGVAIGLFVDGVELDDSGWATRYVYQSETGAQCLRTVRDRKDNGDGSYDLFGPLTGIRAMTDEELKEFGRIHAGTANSVETVAIVDKDSIREDGSVDFRDAFNEKFKPYGVSFVPSGTFGNIYWNGQLVSAFEDNAPDGSYQTLSSLVPGGVVLRAVYDIQGNLVGVEEIKG